MRSDSHGRRRAVGAVLLEVLVGIVLLTTAGLAMVASIGQTITTARDVHEREEDTRSASSALESIELWPRAALDERQGRTRFRRFDMEVERLTSHLYRVAIVDTLRGVTLLETSLYRPDSVSVDRP